MADTQGGKIVVDVEARLAKLDAGLAQAERKSAAAGRRMEQAVSRPLATAGAVGFSTLTKRLFGVSAAFVALGAASRAFGEEFERHVAAPTRTWGEVMADSVDRLAQVFPIVSDLRNVILRDATAAAFENELSKGLAARTSEAEFATRMASTDDPRERARLTAERDLLRIAREMQALRETNAITNGRLGPQIDKLETALKSQVRAMQDAEGRSAAGGLGPWQAQGSPIAGFGTPFGEYRVGPVGSTAATAKARDAEAKRLSERSAKANERTAKAVERLERNMLGFS